MNRILTLLFIICCTQLACKKVIDQPADIYDGKAYFPLQKDKFIEYRVDSTIYDDFLNLIYKKTSFLKDVVDSSFQDLQNRKNHYVIRYYKPHIDSIYRFQYLYYVTDADKTIEVVDNNVRFVKLVLPITFKGSWEGNKYVTSTNSSDPLNWYLNWNYRYTDFDKPLKLDSIKFDKTLTVLQENFLDGDTSDANTNFADFTYSREQYARNVGLVQKDIARINKDFAISTGKRKGFIVKMQAIKHN
jgi:hypothetical protein